jgi:GTP-binding protein
MRASGTDEKMRLSPPIKFSLEESMEYIANDEYVEITPNHLRIRKIVLDENERKRVQKQVLA